MDKGAIQKYAIWARNELIDQIKQRAYQYGISEEGYGEEDALVIAGRVLSSDEQRQRQAFVEKIKEQGFQLAVEEVAYTWFNRFMALRFMEVNDYLPIHIRVFSDANGAFNPQILQDVLHLELEGLDKSKVSELLNANKTDELYRYLLLTQCNALNAALPEMFEKLGSYTEMLLPNNILKQDSILARLVNDINEDDWKDAVQIIGWMYQYYNTEPKQAVFDDLKKNKKITKDKIPAATQLFTPDWIVRYMVENSLGRLWLEHLQRDQGITFPMSFPASTKTNVSKIEKLKANWKYYIDEAEQTPEVKEKLRELRSLSPIKSPEDIRFIDPCMGSGHILVYAFDVLMQIYESEGYSRYDATKLIMEKNLYGLDIDKRACQLSYFSLMMKARQYNHGIFSEGLKPQVYHPEGFPDGEEFGSLAKVDELPPKPEEPDEISIFNKEYEIKLNGWNFQRLLAQTYDVVVTNPPYMGTSSASAKLSNFVKNHYPDGKSDLFAAFIEKCGELLKLSGYQAMITQHAWMFLSSYEKLRRKLFQQDIINMVHLGARAFEEIGGEVVQTTAFVLSKKSANRYQSIYVRLLGYNSQDAKEHAFFASKNLHVAERENFKKIPGNPIAYWVSEAILHAFKSNKTIDDIAHVRQGLATGNNEHYLRIWHEVNLLDFAMNCKNLESFFETNTKYIPYNKGGSYRKWYGNINHVIRFDRTHYETLKTVGNKLPSRNFYFNESITWSKVTSGNISVRYVQNGSAFDVAGCSIFSSSKLKYLLGLVNSKSVQHLLNTLSQTINYEVGIIKSIPFAYEDRLAARVHDLVNQSITLSRTDWDSFETSWDFITHPLITYRSGAGYADTPIKKWRYRIKDAFDNWSSNAEEQFKTLKKNEEELNRIFIDIYGLQDELTPEVDDRDVTVRRADLGRDIRSLISYAVGCMFGRYSLDVDGLAYAGGEWNPGIYKTFAPDCNNILPICDDEYFDDDIVGQFVNFIRTAYGSDTLEENLRFIAGALGGKGTAREAIRNYFLEDFFKDHCKIYKKRPIYWLFDSGKKNGFKALFYLHRYQPDLLARLRTDYVHEQQERYRTQLSHISTAIDTTTGGDRARLLKKQNHLTEQLKELVPFEEKIHHLADQRTEIDLDDGVKQNYKLFGNALAKI